MVYKSLDKGTFLMSSDMFCLREACIQRILNTVFALSYVEISEQLHKYEVLINYSVKICINDVNIAIQFLAWL